MLTKLHVKGFKSLTDLTIEFPRLTVLFGPNAAGKSNILEAAQMLAQIGTSRTLADAFGAQMIRGYPLEAFRFPEGGLPLLLGQRTARMSLEADLDVQSEGLRYRVGVQVRPGSGSLAVFDEYLTRLSKAGKPMHSPVIERVGRQLRVRRARQERPRHEPLGINYALLSDRRLSGAGYEWIDRCRQQFEGWRVYYLDPRIAMRIPRPPAEVRDIGVLGQDVAPYLYRLKAERTKWFDAVRRTLRSLIPAVEDLNVDLDERRGTLDIEVQQDGHGVSSRIISEGTLRVLALCAIAANPWAGGLIAFEEPENGVHARRLELIAHLLTSLAVEQQQRQVIVTTHSAAFCGAMLRATQDCRDKLAMLNVSHGRAGTEVQPFEFANGLFEDAELASGLSAPTEDGVFEGLMLRGLLDE